jgi:nucleoside transporter
VSTETHVTDWRKFWLIPCIIVSATLLLYLIAPSSEGVAAEAKVYTGKLGTADYVKLCIMNFLEFAIWGAWYVVLGSYLNTQGFSRRDIGRIYGTMAIGAMISPLFIGLVADKYFESQIVLAVLHLAGAGLLIAMSRMRTPQSFFWMALAYALAYSPTLALVNGIVFTRCAELNADPNNFPLIRVFGTIGWIMAGLSHRFLIKKDAPMNERPILLAAALSALLGLFAFSLPENPPKASGFTLSEFFGAMGQLIMDVPVFLVVSLIIAMSMGTYFAFGALFVEKRAGVKPHDVGPVMAIGQFVEIGFMLALPWSLGKLGMNAVLAIGISAWALRFGLFSIGQPLALIIIGIALHGICFDFFFAAGFIHIEQIAPEAIRNSAQNLFGFLAYGLGLFLGTELSGWLNQYCTKGTSRSETPPQTASS